MKELLNEWKNFIREEKRIIPKKDGEKEYLINPKQIESVFKYFHLSELYLLDDPESSQFTFEPRVTNKVMSGEDNFTKRISLAPKINRAIYSLDGTTNSMSAPQAALNYNEYSKADKNWKPVLYKYYLYAAGKRNGEGQSLKVVFPYEHVRKCRKNLSYKRDGVVKTIEYFGNGMGQRSWFYYEFKKTLITKLFDGREYRDLTLTEKRIYEAISDSFNLNDIVSRFPEFKDKFQYCIPDVKVSREIWSLVPIVMQYIGTYYPAVNKITASDSEIENLKSLGVV
jgi:hypothetical protein